MRTADTKWKKDFDSLRMLIRFVSTRAGHSGEVCLLLDSQVEWDWEGTG